MVDLRDKLKKIRDYTIALAFFGFIAYYFVNIYVFGENICEEIKKYKAETISVVVSKPFSTGRATYEYYVDGEKYRGHFSRKKSGIWKGDSIPLVYSSKNPEKSLFREYFYENCFEE